MGNPVNLSIMLKYFFSISPEAGEFIKLFFLYLKQNYKRGPFYQQHWVKWEFSLSF